MICKKCGKETLVDGAVYCATCGSRLDGKIQCNNCQQFNDENNAFCVFCGTRIDGKTVCKGCGELVDGAFCARCGTPVVPVSNSVDKKERQPVNPNKQRLWDKIFGLATGGVALAGAAFALIFVFFIGFGMKVLGNQQGVGQISGLTSTPESMNIFYFFGDAYKEIAEMKRSLEMAEVLCADMLIGNMYVYAVICTILAAATIGCVVGFAIPAIISYVKYATGKTEKINSKWAILTIVSFIAGVAMLYAQNYLSVDVYAQDYEYYETIYAKITLTPNALTMTGLVLCIVFASLWLVGKMVSFGGKWKEKAFIKQMVCTAISVGLVSALLAVWQHVTLGTKMLFEGEEEVYALTTIFAPATNNTYFLSMAESLLEGNKIYTYEPNLLAFYACNIVMMFVSIGGTIGVVGCLKTKSSTLEGKEYTGLIFSIITFVFMVAALILLIVMQANMEKIIEVGMETDSVKFTYQYGGCIAALILAGLNLATCITQASFKPQKTE